MNIIRSICSGKKNRFNQDGFNLDLTYITDRIIAMSFPSTGFESAYRNHISTISKFLERFHSKRYKIYNLSGRKYDTKKFKDNVVNQFAWADHHPPPIDILVSLSQSIFNFLKQNRENVVILHCNAGKGRTGTGICASLIFTGFVSTAAEAIHYYGHRRFSTGKGVTQPSQQRYVYYFEEIYNKRIQSPTIKTISRITVEGIPKIKRGGIRPFFALYQADPINNRVYCNRKAVHIMKEYYSKTDTEFFDIPSITLMVVGDIHLKLFHLKKRNEPQLVCRISLNTAFIPQNNIYEFKKEVIDPDSVKNDKSIPDNFKISIEFKNVCDECTAETKKNDLCVGCKEFIDKNGQMWDSIEAIINSHLYPSPDQKIGGDPSYLEERLKKETKEFGGWKEEDQPRKRSTSNREAPSHIEYIESLFSQITSEERKEESKEENEALLSDEDSLVLLKQDVEEGESVVRMASQNIKTGKTCAMSKSDNESSSCSGEVQINFLPPMRSNKRESKYKQIEERKEGFQHYPSQGYEDHMENVFQQLAHPSNSDKAAALSSPSYQNNKESLDYEEEEKKEQIIKENQDN